MRYAIILCALFVLGCDDEFDAIYYANGAEWENVSVLPPTKIPPGDMDARQFAQWAQGAVALPERDNKTHTPSSADYTGWSAPPAGSFKYIDTGSFVLLWTDDELTGTSDFGSLAVAVLPSNIRPAQTVHAASSACIDNGVFVGCFAQVTSGGSLQMFNMNTTDFTYGNNWTASGTKGWPRGWSILYRKL